MRAPPAVLPGRRLIVRRFGYICSACLGSSVQRELGYYVALHGVSVLLTLPLSPSVCAVSLARMGQLELTRQGGYDWTGAHSAAIIS